MTKKKYYTWQDIEAAVNTLVVQMFKDNWRPDYIVGITRGGLPVATMLSNLTGVPMHALGISFRDANMGPESNLWMAEDAFGYVTPEDRAISPTGCRWDVTARAKILIVDDINDTGRTFNWVKEDWQSGCLPNEDYAWKSIWNHNVRFAVVTENLSSDFGDVRYMWDVINKAEDDQWIVYPWEHDALTRGGQV